MDGRYFPIVNISQTIEQICKYGSLNDLQISQTVVDTLVTSIRFKKKILDEPLMVLDLLYLFNFHM